MPNQQQSGGTPKIGAQSQTEKILGSLENSDGGSNTIFSAAIRKATDEIRVTAISWCIPAISPASMNRSIEKTLKRFDTW